MPPAFPASREPWEQSSLHVPRGDSPEECGELLVGKIDRTEAAEERQRSHAYYTDPHKPCL